MLSERMVALSSRDQVAKETRSVVLSSSDELPLVKT
jgi:hypothetical protein